MIPKTIHYVWLGDKPKPKKIKKCIASWKRFCPDYKIIEWNEENFDINSNSFIKAAYDSQKYAFASDVIRLIVLEKYGGIYVDADVEFLKPLDDLLDNESFVGFETNEYINSGQILGSVPKNKILSEHIKKYDDIDFLRIDDITSITCPKIFTDLLVEKGLVLDGSEQIISGVHIYTVEYFNPFDTKTGKMSKTKNSYSIHWSAHSWIDRNPLVKQVVRICHRLFGVDCFEKIRAILRR